MRWTLAMAALLVACAEPVPQVSVQSAPLQGGPEYVPVDDNVALTAMKRVTPSPEGKTRAQWLADTIASAPVVVRGDAIISTSQKVEQISASPNDESTLLFLNVSVRCSRGTSAKTILVRWQPNSEVAFPKPSEKVDLFLAGSLDKDGNLRPAVLGTVPVGSADVSIAPSQLLNTPAGVPSC